MKVNTVLSTAVLILLPAVIVPSFAQEHEREKEPEQKQQAPKPAQRQQQVKPANHTQPAQHSPKQAQHPQAAKPVQQQQQHAARQTKAAPARQAQRTSRAQQPAAAAHGRIPDDRFRASFGRAHTFRVNRSEFANGSGRFQYGGFWFNAVQPWPVGWLYTDNVYVDFLNGGYVLCNPLHPGVYISVNIG